MQIVELKLIVASQANCDKLVKMGVIDASALCWNNIGMVSAAIMEDNPVSPAYTMEELIIALGGSVLPPVLPEDRPRANENEDITFRFYFTDKFREYSNGADAAADVLIYCLENNILDLQAVNSRLERKFKPF